MKLKIIIFDAFTMLQTIGKYICFKWAKIALIVLFIQLNPLYLYSSEPDSTIRKEIINMIIDGIQKMDNSEFDSAIDILNKADSLSIANKFPKLQASCQYNLGVSYYRTGNYVLCGELFDRALSIISNTDDSIAMAQYNLGVGILHKKKGDYKKATTFVLNAIRILENTDKTQEIASAYNTLAGIQNKMQNDSLALNYYKKSLDLYKHINDSNRIAATLNNIGNFYVERIQYKNALRYLKRSFDIKRRIHDSTSISSTLNLISEIHSGLNTYDSVNYYLNLAFKYALKSKDSTNLIETSHLKTKYFLKKGYVDSALYYVQLALDIALQNDIKYSLIENYKLSSKVFEQLGDFQKSLKYSRLYQITNNEILSAELAKNINDIQFQYETDKKDLEIKNLNTVNQIKTESIKTRNFSLLIISFLLLGSIILMILLYKAYQQKSTAHKKIQFLMHEKQHRTKNNLQLLSSVLSLQSLYSQKEEKDISKEVENRVQSIVLLDRILYETNIEGDEVDLSLYINELILGIKEAYTFNKKLEINTNLVHLMIAAEQAKFIGLLVNEIITNSFKYAFNSTPNPQLDISILPHKADLYRLIIRDNGPGLPEGYKTKNKNSLGMKLIDTMSRQLKGDYLIDNREGFYFHLEFKIKKGLN